MDTSLQRSLPPKRRRQVFSCNECRRRKLKCDRNVPCNRCVKSGCPGMCLYTSHNKRSPTERKADIEHDRRDSMPTRPADYKPQEVSLIAETGQITPASTYVPVDHQDNTIADLQSRVTMLESLLAERTHQPSQQSPYDNFSLRSDGGLGESWPNQSGLRKIHFMKDFLHGKNSNTSFHGRSHWYPIFGQVCSASVSGERDN